MLGISFDVKVNKETVFRLINAKHQILKPFLLVTWLKYENKKTAEFFNAYSTAKFAE